MTAAMNASINLSIPDGWVPEFAKNKENAFIIEPASDQLSVEERDKVEAQNLLNLLENEIIPTYYEKQEAWVQIMKASMRDVVPYFDAGRMADEYYQRLYNYQSSRSKSEDRDSNQFAA
jgi:glycogen phosphorylase